MKIQLTLRIWILIFFLVVAILAINPFMAFENGVLIKNVEKNSSVDKMGFIPGEIIKEVNGKQILSVEDYSNSMKLISLQPIQYSILTDKGLFEYQDTVLGFSVNDIHDNTLNITSSLITFVSGNASNSGLKVNMTLLEINNNKISSVEEFEQAKNKIEPRINTVIKTNMDEYILSLNSPPDFVVSDIPSSNIKTGLDLRGGARGLVKPEEKLSANEINDLILVSKERLNVYGIADINVRTVTDLSGNNYMLVEVAGATPEDLKELIGKQGKFEAKIGNNTVFFGGKSDIPSVCRNDASCSRIERCFPTENGYNCEFMFSIYLSEESAKRQADITNNLVVNSSANGAKQYLNESLDLYLDDKLVDTLMISSDLKGKATTQIAISGPGLGKTQAEAYKDAQKSMLKLQTVLITGSLPYKLEIVKLDSISPLLGKEFTKNLIYVLVAAIISVSFVLFFRYKRPILVIPIIGTMISETLIVLGIAALINWNIDVASIAGIIAATGTGVNDQIVIIDESDASKAYSWKERIKKAFSIILGAFAVTVAAMLPLWWAGAGLLKGFALTTILGICIGVFITRPAFADIVSKITKD